MAVVEEDEGGVTYVVVAVVAAVVVTSILDIIVEPSEVAAAYMLETLWSWNVLFLICPRAGFPEPIL
jgi:hypothetical protein